MNFLAIPSIFAFLIKIGIIHKSRQLNHSKELIGLLLVFSIHNACEIVLFFQDQIYMAEYWAIRAYYCSSLLSATYLVLYGLKIGGFIRFNKFTLLALAIPLLPAVFIAFSDLIITGNTFQNGKYFASHGPFYEVFSIYVFASQILMCGALVYGYFAAKDLIVKNQCLYVGVALLPIFLSVVVVIVSQKLGITANTLTMLPLASTLFLFILYKGESAHGLTDLRKWIPFSTERKASNQISSAESDYFLNRISFLEFKNRVERIALLKALSDSDGCITHAAKSMDMNRSTMYSMLKKHGIKKDDR